MTENHSKLNGIREDFGMFCSLCDPTLLEVLREKVEDQSQEWQRIEDRLRSKIAGLKVSSSPICIFFCRIRIYHACYITASLRINE